MKLWLLLLVVATGCTSIEVQEHSTVTVNSESQQFVFSVEIAQTPEKLQKGLMFREFLGENEGMLFIFTDSKERSFWMKNTLIPLDMIFIDENFVIRKIHYAVPCKQDPCPSYTSGVPVKYVLEINGNQTTENNIKEGDVVEIKQ
jgi:hypothetical protein